MRSRAADTENVSIGSSPWGVAAVIGVLAAVIEGTVVGIAYRDLGLPDRGLFVVCYASASLSAIALGGGALAAVGRRLGRGWSPRVGTAIGVGAAVAGILLGRVGLMLQVASAGVPEERVSALAGPLSPLGLAGIAAACVFGALAASVAFVVERSRWIRARRMWMVGVLAAMVSVGAFGIRTDAHEVPSPATARASGGVDSPLSAETTNVLLISIDTLRADHLRGYGYARDTSPAVDALGDRGIRFERALTQRTNTAPSMATVLTGTYPPAHLVLDNHQYLQDFNVTLAEVLSANGYYSAAMVQNPNLTEEFNFDQGFTELHQVPTAYRIGDPPPIKSQLVNERALAILEKVRDRRFFLWLHYSDPHSPYVPPPEYQDLFMTDAYSDVNGARSAPVCGLRFGCVRPGTVRREGLDVDGIIAQYDAEIRFNDGSVAAVFEALDRMGLWDNTLVIVLADHGESMWEHDYYFNHGDTVFEPTAHVPLIIYHPSLAVPRRVKVPVSLVDLLPTIAELLQLPTWPQLQGESFARVLVGGDTEGLRPRHFIMASHRAGYQTHAVTTETHKLVLDVDERWVFLDATVERLGRLWVPDEAFNVYRFRRIRPEFYDLVTDPGEVNDIKGSGGAVEADLKATLWDWIDSAYRERGRRSVAPSLSPKTIEELRALGYL